MCMFNNYKYRNKENNLRMLHSLACRDSVVHLVLLTMDKAPLQCDVLLPYINSHVTYFIRLKDLDASCYTCAYIHLIICKT